MSHDATNWAIQQRGLKPTTKIVLWHLCDRFNPDYGCFPSQNRLAYDSEISRSTLNDHIGQLEAAGLLRRVPRIDPCREWKLGLPKIAATSGRMMWSTSDWTTAAKATPRAMPMAMSTRLPPKAKVLNSLHSARMGAG